MSGVSAWVSTWLTDAEHPDASLLRVLLIADDGRNISLSGSGTTADQSGSVGKDVLHFTTEVQNESVVARGRVVLEAAGTITSIFQGVGLVSGQGTTPAASRLFLTHNNINYGNVYQLSSDDVGTGIVAKRFDKNSTDVTLFAHDGNPGGDTLYRFDFLDPQDYRISLAEIWNSPPSNGYAACGQKITLMIRNRSTGTSNITFSPDFTLWGSQPMSVDAGQSRLISFVVAESSLVTEDRQGLDLHGVYPEWTLAECWRERRVLGGRGKTTGHRGTVTFPTPLQGLWSDYVVLVTADGALLDQAGAHVIGYGLDAQNNFAAFEVYTDEALADFSWMVVSVS